MPPADGSPSAGGIAKSLFVPCDELASVKDYPHGPARIDQSAKDLRGRQVVKGVSFRVEQGEIVGPARTQRRAGKTTSFRMTCGLVEPDAGKVTLNGLDVTHWPM